MERNIPANTSRPPAIAPYTIVLRRYACRLLRTRIRRITPQRRSSPKRNAYGSAHKIGRRNFIVSVCIPSCTKIRKKLAGSSFPPRISSASTSAWDANSAAGIRKRQNRIVPPFPDRRIHEIKSSRFLLSISLASRFRPY